MYQCELLINNYIIYHIYCLYMYYDWKKVFYIYFLKMLIWILPQIFKGASNSKRIGCDRNISRDFKQRPRISPSDSCTCFPGRAPRTVIQNIKIKFGFF